MTTPDIVDAELCPFAFVGCWNRELQSKSAENPLESPRDLVAAAIRDSGLSTVILGGDNIYPPWLVAPDGIETIKLTDRRPFRPRYERGAFRRGARLYSTVPHLWVAIGNHNIDKASEFDIYEEQRATFGPVSLPAPYYTRQFRDGRRIVVIDTNTVDAGREADFTAMCDWLATVAQGEYLLVQHIPFICLSSARRDGSWSRPVLRRARELLDVFLRPGVTPPTAILCADTHNFQYGVVSYKGLEIPQFVVGTGGARPDPLPATMKQEDWAYKPSDTPGLSYRMMSTADSYGYLRVDAADATSSNQQSIVHGGLQFTFVSVAPWTRSDTEPFRYVYAKPWPPSRGGRRQRTRRRQSRRKAAAKTRRHR
jgi:hypothetical protein